MHFLPCGHAGRMMSYPSRVAFSFSVAASIRRVYDRDVTAWVGCSYARLLRLYQKPWVSAVLLAYLGLGLMEQRL